MEEPDPPLPPPKVFKPKHNLTVLLDYSKPAPPSFWETFPWYEVWPAKSAVSAAKIEGLAMALGCSDWDRLRVVCGDLTNGADIGCAGIYRKGSASSNAPSAMDFPREITDAVCDWVTKGFAFGPVDLADLPAGAKVNGIMCRVKPNGGARIILNMSAPSGRSVNDGIDNTQFPAAMSSTGKWLQVLDEVGRNCTILKIDWADAYKHVPVREADLNLQWFSWLGKYFAELCLIFGTASSVGIYDRLAKVILDLVLRLAKFPPQWVCQHLDDVCAAAPAGSEALTELDQAYMRVAAQVGISLASRDDPDKSFAPCQKGTVLGVAYDTAAWTWEIQAEKAGRVLRQLRGVLEAESVRQAELWSLAGRIIHYGPLIPCGRFNLNYIILASAESEDPNHMVSVSDDLKRQIWFWITMIKTCNGGCRIPRPAGPLPVWAVQAFTDAAGGSMAAGGRGTSGVCGSWWFFVPWSRRINCGARADDGKKLARKLSALELVGPLIVVAAGYLQWRGKDLKIWVDNAGSVLIWKKGYSTRCALCTTMVKAIGTVAAALDCRVDIVKITRCSNTGAKLADSLSKAEFREFRDEAEKEDWQLDTAPAWVPTSILAWIARPVADDLLGEKILRELTARTPLLTSRCWLSAAAGSGEG
jgi:hypothetical protein